MTTDEKGWAIEGKPDRYCRSCSAPLRFVRNSNNKLEPINMKSGKNHFEDCPDAKSFHKPKG